MNRYQWTLGGRGRSILVAPGAIILGISALSAPVVVNQGPRILWVCVCRHFQSAPPPRPEGRDRLGNGARGGGKYSRNFLQ